MPRLYVIATPIGNLEDISQRARRLLGEVQLILAEDTRVTGKLLRAFDIKTPLQSLHGHNERSLAAPLLARILSEDLDVALVSDAGTPGISDPGSYFVAQARAAGIQVLAVPGPSAMVSALSISGFTEGEFTFFGFLPRKANERRQKLMDMAGKTQLAILYEAPHRLRTLLEAIQGVYPNATIFLARELSKLHEQSLLGTASSLLTQLDSEPNMGKGEFVLILNLSQVPAKATQDSPGKLPLEAQLVSALIDGQSLQEAMESLVKNGQRKNQVYAASLRLKTLLQAENFYTEGRP